MNSPSFINSRMPSAFGAYGSVRPAGQTAPVLPQAIPQATYGNNTWNNVAFYDAAGNPVVPVPPTTPGPFYSQYGYEIGQSGDPKPGQPPAPWAQLGAQGQAFLQPGTGYMLDINGHIITTDTAQNLNTVTNPGAGDQITPALNAVTNAVTTNWPVVAAIAVVGIVALVAYMRGGPAPQPVPAAVRSNPRKRARRFGGHSHAGRHPKFDPERMT